ncbi:MAG: hypothetical protein ABI852_18340 [Gemmatimonadaceae bacterium]
MIRSIIAVVLVVSVASASATPVASVRATTHAVVRAVDSTHVLDLHVNVSSALFAVVRSVSERNGEPSGRETPEVLRSPVSIDVGEGAGSVTLSASEPILLTVKPGLTVQGKIVRLIRDSVGGRLYGTAQ